MKTLRITGLAIALVALATTPLIAARGVTLKGSDTMVILAQRWAEEYMNSHSGEVVQVTGGGSGTGIASLINGTTDICMSSRPMKPDEKKKLRDRYQTMGVELPVARDGLTIYVHESNPVKELTLEQLRLVYTGATTNWKQLGGADSRIVLYSRENSSGTYVYFKDHVLKGQDYAASAQTLPGTAAVVNAVARDPNGIGYGGAAYAKGIRDCAVRKDENTKAVLPGAATVKDGSYPVARDLYLYTRVKPSGDAKKFIDFVLSDDGQSLATQVGYFPVK